MQLPPPSPLYDPQNEGQARATLQREDARNRKKGEDVEMGTSMLILTSPNGTRYTLAVSNAGVLTAVLV